MHTKLLFPVLLPDSGTLPRRSDLDGESLKSDDSAVLAITDFSREQPATIDPDRQIDDALNDMIQFGVRALLVAKEQRIVGLVTSYDIQGERPMQFLQTSTYAHHHELRVSHVMTPWSDLHALDWHQLQLATAGELKSVFDEGQFTHLIVVEQKGGDHASATVRGLASRARLTRQLAGRRDG